MAVSTISTAVLTDAQDYLKAKWESPDLRKDAVLAALSDAQTQIGNGNAAMGMYLIRVAKYLVNLDNNYDMPT